MTGVLRVLKWIGSAFCILVGFFVIHHILNLLGWM